MFRLVVHDGALYYVCVMVHDYEIRLTTGNSYLDVSEDMPFIPTLEEWHLVSSLLNLCKINLVCSGFFGLSL